MAGQPPLKRPVAGSIPARGTKARLADLGWLEERLVTQVVALPDEGLEVTEPVGVARLAGGGVDVEVLPKVGQVALEGGDVHRLRQAAPEPARQALPNPDDRHRHREHSQSAGHGNRAGHPRPHHQGPARRPVHALPGHHRRRQAPGRTRRKAPGYTGAAKIPDPAVVTLNGTVASAAATEVLQLVTGFAGDSDPNCHWINDGLTGTTEPVLRSARAARHAARSAASPMPDPAGRRSSHNVLHTEGPPAGRHSLTVHVRSNGLLLASAMMGLTADRKAET
jgi:hypothetical protein